MKKFLSGILSIVLIFTCCKDTAFGVRSARLRDFGTISKLAEYLRSEYGMSTHDLTADILAFNGISWEQARHLGPNTVIKIPPTRAEYEEAERQINQWKNEQIAQIRSRVNQQKKEAMENIQRGLAEQKNQAKQKIAKDIQVSKENAIRELKSKRKQEIDAHIEEIKRQESQILAQISVKKEQTLQQIRGLAAQRKQLDNLSDLGIELKVKLENFEHKSNQEENSIEFLKALEKHLNNKMCRASKESETDETDLQKLQQRVQKLMAEYVQKQQATLDEDESTTNSNDQIQTFRNESDSQTTIEDLVKFDGANEKYATYAQRILGNITSKEFRCVESSACDLENICTKVCNVFRKINQKFGMSPHPVQVMTVLRMADDILNSHGSIAQVKTGEGKSFVIAVLTIVLSQFGRKVDIVTSTEELARRDQNNQKKYYDLFGITNGVLKRTVPSDDSESNGFNLDSLKNSIVYSTNSNFEFVYLHSVFRKKPLRDRPYDVVIVDEIDNMLLDQAMSPAIIANQFSVKNAEEIFRNVYQNRRLDFGQVLHDVKKFFPHSEVPIYTIQMLFDAARRSDGLVKDKNYVVKGGQVQIIDQSTGYVKPGSRWNNFLHEMVEIKENVKMKQPSVSHCLVTQKSFFNMYNKIGGLTGTIGSDEDKNLLIKSYNVKVFYIPRDLPSKQKVFWKQRTGSIDEVFAQINEDVLDQNKNGVPVLVIMDSKKQVDDFCCKYFPSAKKITGVDLDSDESAIRNAGNVGAVTVATNAAGRGIDIALNEKSLKNGGLHVIIPFMPENKRILEQAMGRSARQGRPGAVTIYASGRDNFLSTPDFNKNYEKLLELQTRFSQHVKQKWPWMYEHENAGCVFKGGHTLGATPSDVLKDASRECSCTVRKQATENKR